MPGGWKMCDFDEKWVCCPETAAAENLSLKNLRMHPVETNITPAAPNYVLLHSPRHIWNKFPISTLFRFRWHALSGINCRRTSSSSSKISPVVSSSVDFDYPTRFTFSSFTLVCSDSCKKLENVLEEFCGATPTTTYKFNQDDVSVLKSSV